MYERLAGNIEASVRQRVLLPGERIASVRQCAQQNKLSITTVLKAYVLLESKGIIESRPQSGYFVRVRLEAPAALELKASRPLPISAEVDVSRLVLSTLRSIQADGAVPLGSPIPDPSLFPLARLSRHESTLSKRQRGWTALSDLPPGNPELIRQIARRYLESGLSVDPSEVVVTFGATEAINLCLQAVAKPGDVVAVESPTFYANLHAIERLGMRAIEVDTDPQTGIDLDAFQKIICQHSVAACMVMPNFQNPLGFEMPADKKRELVDLTARHGIPIIENDVYRELGFDDVVPTSLKAYDKEGLVLHCSSFSKSLAPMHRVGWAIPGKFHAKVERLKFLNTPSMAAIPQLAIAEYLKYDGYDHHLRKMRRLFAQQAGIMTAVVKRFYPPGTTTSTPKGGYVLWIGLPDGIDSMELYQDALRLGITIGPGYMFSTSNSFKNYIRLNYSFAWTNDIEQAVITVGQLAFARLSQESRQTLHVEA